MRQRGQAASRSARRAPHTSAPRRTGTGSGTPPRRAAAPTLAPSSAWLPRLQSLARGIHTVTCASCVRDGSAGRQVRKLSGKVQRSIVRRAFCAEHLQLSPPALASCRLQASAPTATLQKHSPTVTQRRRRTCSSARHKAMPPCTPASANAATALYGLLHLCLGVAVARQPLRAHVRQVRMAVETKCTLAWQCPQLSNAT